MSTRTTVWPVFRATIGAAPNALHRGWRHGKAQWRRSLQLRVVTSTLVVSSIVVALLGFFLMQQIANGLLRAKVSAALTEASAGLTVAQNQYQASATGNAGPYDRTVLLDKLASTLARRSGTAGLYEVIILHPPGGGRTATELGRATNAISPRSVPPRLRESLGEGGGERQQHTWTRLYYTDGTTAPGLVVGSSLGPYQLYHLFPLTEERETLELVQRLLIAVGAGLVLLLAAIAWLVTRQVVTPVRMAAQAAERLAAGELAERMKVRGEDDLARLATSFNQMAKNLQEKIHELEELSQVQRQFVSDVSHELRTPLATVRIAADVLYEHRDEFDDATARSAELLQTQLERFEALLTDLLEISRYDAGAATLDAESVDVRDIVLRAVGDTEHLAEQHNTKIVPRLPGTPCIAEVDARRMERIMRNLIVNAIEHGEGRDIVIMVAADRDAVAVAVRDHGVGLRPGEASQVFERFWRADPARTRRMGGTGLGLSIAREDARLHGGWLQAWGEPGRGSQFRLSLPRIAGQRLRGSPLPLVPPDLELTRARLDVGRRQDYGIYPAPQAAASRHLRAARLPAGGTRDGPDQVTGQAAEHLPTGHDRVPTPGHGAASGAHGHPDGAHNDSAEGAGQGPGDRADGHRADGHHTEGHGAEGHGAEGHRPDGDAGGRDGGVPAGRGGTPAGGRGVR